MTHSCRLPWNCSQRLKDAAESRVRARIAGERVRILGLSSDMLREGVELVATWD